MRTVGSGDTSPVSMGCPPDDRWRMAQPAVDHCGVTSQGCLLLCQEFLYRSACVGSHYAPKLVEEFPIRKVHLARHRVSGHRADIDGIHVCTDRSLTHCRAKQKLVLREPPDPVSKKLCLFVQGHEHRFFSNHLYGSPRSASHSTPMLHPIGIAKVQRISKEPRTRHGCRLSERYVPRDRTVWRNWSSSWWGDWSPMVSQIWEDRIYCWINSSSSTARGFSPASAFWVNATNSSMSTPNGISRLPRALIHSYR
jgi:hypothetical protein